MKLKYKIILGICLLLLIVAFYCNWKYEVIAVHPFREDGCHELKVMTWNVHCSSGTDSLRQKEIANLVLKENVDLVLLNEYNQDSCSIADSILKTQLPFTVEYHSHKNCGDIIYSKRIGSNSGYVYKHISGKGLRPIKTTIAIGCDSVQIFGVHLDSNNKDDRALERASNNNSTSYEVYKRGRAVRSLQAHLIKGVVLESNHPVIVMGDMNDFNCSAPLDTFVTCGLKDSWWEGGNGLGNTFHDGWMRLRIDHILHSKELKLESIKVIETDLSDHNPVVAGFSISK